MTGNIVYIDDIERIQLRFTELGKTLADLSDQTNGYMDETTEYLEKGFTSFTSTILGNEDVAKFRNQMQVADESLTELSKLFETIAQGADTAFMSLAAVAQSSQASFNNLVKDLEDAKKQALVPDTGAKVEGGFGQWFAKLRSPKKKTLPKGVRKEISSLKSKAKGFMSKLHIPSAGAFAAGIVGILAYSYIYKDRIRAEAGEVKNALESAVDAGYKGLLRKGTATFSALQEHLQKYVGINREELQNILKTTAQGGVAIDDVLKRVDRGLGLVGKNFATFTLGIDKLFEMPGGVSAEKAVGFMHNYGMSLSEAGKTVKDLYLNQQAANIGAPTFVRNVEAAADSIKDLGFSIRSVIDIAGQLQAGFENIGVPKQFAGKLAGVGIQQMAQGIANLSDDWKVMMGEMQSGKKGVEALQWFEESFSRIQRGGSIEEYKDLVLNFYKLAQKISKGNEAEAYTFLNRGVGMGSYGARSVLEIGKIAQEKGDIAAVQATHSRMKDLKEAFHTEASKKKMWERHMNKWMEGLSQVGQGLLGLIGKTLAFLVAYFRSLPTLFMKMIKMDQKGLLDLGYKIRGFTKGWRDDVSLMKKGVAEMGSAGKEMFGDVFSSSIDALSSAFTTDFSGQAPSAEAPPPATSSGSGDTSTARPITKTIFIPVGTPGTYQAEMMPEADAVINQWIEEKGMQWVGGGLSIQSQGVDEQGNILINIIGNCPRCGLLFGGADGVSDGAFSSMGLAGEGKYTGKDVEALGRTLATEMGGYSPERHNEAVGILQTAMNRSRGKGGDALYNTVTSGHGWGAQGSDRQYGSRRKFKKGGGTEKFVRDFLQGKVNIPEKLKQATGFFHVKQGDVFRNPKKKYKGSMPYFARQGGLIDQYESKLPGRRVMFWRKGQDTAEGRDARRWLEAGQSKSTEANEKPATQEAAATTTLDTSLLPPVTALTGM
jgi:hypothetical protein